MIIVVVYIQGVNIAIIEIASARSLPSKPIASLGLSFVWIFFFVLGSFQRNL